MNVDELEDWALRAVQTLQDIVDEAQESSGNPDGTDALIDIRQLIEEHQHIQSGLPVWQIQLRNK